MNQSRRKFLRGLAGWGGVVLAGVANGRIPEHPADGRVGEPLRRAHRFLTAAQSADGAWRSERYAAFREGDVLTPLVLWALPCPQIVASRSGLLVEGDDLLRQSFDRGLTWLKGLTDRLSVESSPWATLSYPLFTASYAAQIFIRAGDPGRALAWAKIVEQLRTREPLGWPLDDPMTGAWSDAAMPPRYVTPVPDMLAPNISATALAAIALQAAGLASASALPFIEHCQNFASTAPEPRDDGGFFFALDDPIRNKAGSTGRDPRGRARFRSYGSATCDGYLALRASGLAHDHPRVCAAAEWLRRVADGSIAGEWAAGRGEARASLAFYEAQGQAAVLADLPPETPWAGGLRATLAARLIAGQQETGEWQGFAPDSCEDEPLLATAFAARALALLR